MHLQSLSTFRPTRYRRMVVSAAIALLLWGLWVFSTHTHDDHAHAEDVECVLCDFGLHNAAALPVAGLSLPPELPERISDAFPESTFISTQIRLHDVRAPPPVS
ncbi:MAG: hypothetical protein KDJ38_09475 [Gammaproteobacteria bacterium]|nr:hypothetical protein [Gammaproteobacteria bacterium]